MVVGLFLRAVGKKCRLLHHTERSVHQLITSTHYTVHYDECEDSEFSEDLWSPYL
jgi:hypothetical protein